jgi:hypothetical protein
MKHPFFVLFFVVIPLHYILKLLLPEVGAWLVVAHGLIGGRTLTRLPGTFRTFFIGGRTPIKSDMYIQSSFCLRLVLGLWLPTVSLVVAH